MDVIGLHFKVVDFNGSSVPFISKIKLKILTFLYCAEFANFTAGKGVNFVLLHLELNRQYALLAMRIVNENCCIKHC